MAKHTIGKLPLVEVWQATVLRLSVFPSQSAEINDADWWSDLVGRDPDSKSEQPRRGTKQVMGAFESGRLNLNISPGKIDWIFEAVFDVNSEEKGPPYLGAFSDVKGIFLKLMHNWLKFETTPEIHRLAFGAKLLIPVDSYQQGNEIMDIYLPAVEVDTANSTDLSYQINRPRVYSGEISNLIINRLAKWSVLRWLITIGEKEVLSSQVGSGFVCELELDINTADEFQGALPQEKLVDLFTELLRQGVEIASEGDIK